MTMIPSPHVSRSDVSITNWTEMIDTTMHMINGRKRIE
jgi:hypothetical protein